MTTRLLLALPALVLAAPPQLAAQPAGDAGAALIGKPTGLVVQPATVVLVGPHAQQQLVILGKYADGTVRDLTRACLITSDTPGVAAVTPDGRVVPQKDGTTTLIVRAGGYSVLVPVAVRDHDREQAVSFRHEVMAALNVGGCNAGACHGTPAGKNGFRLSLRGHDPAADYLQLTRHGLARHAGAADSLLLLKALGRVPHEGDPSFPAGSVPGRLLRAWLAQGSPDDPAAPAVKRLEVFPGTAILTAPGNRQQLLVLAHFGDGSVRDVTALTVFSSSDDDIARVAPGGLVEFARSGEAAILCRYLETMQTVLLTYSAPPPDFAWKAPPENNYIDKHVFAKLKLLGIPPSDLCADHEFIRRAFLDVCAVLPTPAEVKAFLADPAPDKRARLIDKLLDRPEYADFWTFKWCEVLRVSQATMGGEGANRYHKWLHDRVRQNTPFDKVVRDLLTAAGNTFTEGPANYYRVAQQPEALAEATTELFLGVRLGCARCHTHPHAPWTPGDYYGTVAFFARVKVKTDKKVNPTTVAATVYVDAQGEVADPRTGAVVLPRFPGGKRPDLAPGADRRAAFADWLTSPDNPYFARAVVNRLWAHVFGRGLVDPPDDLRDSNPPANAALLDALARDFIDHKFDVKYILRLMLNSRTYQLSAAANDLNRDDTRYFSHLVPKPLTAEQLLDAISQVTEVPETIPGMPSGTRLTQLPESQSVPPFLTISRPGRPLPCECEREDRGAASALHLLGSSPFLSKIEQGKNCLTRLLAAKKDVQEMTTELFLRALSREPTAKEQDIVVKHLAARPGDARRPWEDVLWALISSREFSYRH
jgi:hypothetical protein